MSLSIVNAPSPRHATYLKKILQRCRRSPGAPSPVVVFDLDGTLLDNRPRTLAILRHFASFCRGRDADLAWRLENAQLNDLEYLLRETLIGLGVESPALCEEIEAFWQARFFGDASLAHDVPVIGAVDFVRACHTAGALVVYLTGRDLPAMGVGTFQSLRDWGFPIGAPGTELVLKPDVKIPDEAFKRGAAPELVRVGPVVAAFDNEPGNCNVMMAQYPDASVVLVDTQHTPKAPALHPSVRVVVDFRL